MEVSERHEKVDFFAGEEQLQVFHISDIHLWFSTKVLENLEASIIKNNPDLIVMTGDYYDLPKGAKLFRMFLQKIAKKYSIVFIIGNHDRWYGSKVSRLLSDIPNCFSVEDVVFKYVSKRGFRYHITSWKNSHNLPKDSDEKNIVLIHNPEKIRKEKLANIHLIFAGHLHGGQFIFYKTKSGANFPGSLLYKHCSDRKRIYQTTLIVSKGLGDTFPFRFNCPKEVVCVEIV